MEKSLFYTARDYIAPYGLPFRLMFYHQESKIMHFHDFEELVFVLEGSGTHQANQEKYPIFAGTVFLIPRGVSHTYLSASNLLLANLLFDLTDLNNSLGDLTEISGFKALFEMEPALRQQYGFKAKFTLSPSTFQEIRTLLMKLERECSARAPGFQTISKAFFHEILGILARSYGQDEKKSSRKMIALSEMILYMEKHYSEKITREMIVKVGKVSIRVASRIFQELSGKSMISTLLELRIHHACRILRNTDRSISEIAYQCGFNDSNYFALQFKKQTGVSASEYRKQNRLTYQNSEERF